MNCILRFRSFIAVAIFAAIIGCRDNSVARFEGDLIDLTQRESSFPTGRVDLCQNLTSNDVLVAVNGYPLTKKTFDEICELRTKFIMRSKDANHAFVNNQLADFKKKYLGFFISRRILLDRARELNVLSQEELNKRVNAIVTKRAKASRKTIDQFVKSYPGDFRYCLSELAESILLNELVKQHIPPKIAVDKEFIAELKKGIKEDNATTTASNAVLKATMLRWKTDIIAGKETFETMAKLYNQDADTDDYLTGAWGTFERGQFPDKAIQAVVFSLKDGEISDPVEDDEGFHLIKVVHSLPPERNEKGRIVLDERRELKHIYVKKEPLLLEEEDTILMGEMKRQMQMRAIDEYVKDIRTNGITRIEFPHGTDLF